MSHTINAQVLFFAKRGTAFAVAGMAFFAASAYGHDAWLDTAPQGAAGQFLVRFTDDSKPLPYPQAKLTRVWGINAGGKTLNVTPVMEGELARISAPPGAELLALEFDNGFYSKTTQGTVNKPRNEAPGSISALWAQKGGKYVMQWSAVSQKPVGLKLEIVPLSSAAPKAGDQLAVQVLWDGKPVEGLKVSKGEHESGVKTDAQGRATYKVEPGRNFVWTERRVKVEGDPRFDSLAFASNLVFTVK